MITSFECPCGNKNVSKTKEYDGVLGYSAIICMDCGRFSDHTGSHEADDFSKGFVGITN